MPSPGYLTASHSPYAGLGAPPYPGVALGTTGPHIPSSESLLIKVAPPPCALFGELPCQPPILLLMYRRAPDAAIIVQDQAKHFLNSVVHRRRRATHCHQ
jgi:hypothetical protein